MWNLFHSTYEKIYCMKISCLTHKLAEKAIWTKILVGIVVDMSWQHVICGQFLADMGDTQILWLNESWEWHVTSCCALYTALLGDIVCCLFFFACCDVTKKDFDVTSHPSCQQHVTKYHMLLTLLPSILILQQMTIPAKTKMYTTINDFIQMFYLMCGTSMIDFIWSLACIIDQNGRIVVNITSEGADSGMGMFGKSRCINFHISLIGLIIMP